MRLDIHVTREMWEALDEGRLPEEFLRVLLRDHLTAICPACRTEYEEYRAARPGEVHLRPTRSEPAQAGPPLELERLAADAGEERARAEADLAELLQLDGAAGEQRIARATTRFRSPFLAELLNTEARRALAAEPERSRQLARWAERVLERPGDDARFRWRELEMESLILQGDASRRLGELAEAEALFRRARAHVNPAAPSGTNGVADLALIAELDWREGTLLGDRGRHRAGETLLVRSIFLNALAGRTLRVQSVRLSLSILYHHAGRVEDALHIVDEILAELAPDDDPMLYHLARYTRVLCLVDGDQVAEARQDADALEPLTRGLGGEAMALRSRWLQGRILLEEEPTRAVGVLADIASAYQERGEGYPAAFASLDLAIALLKCNEPQRAGTVVRDLPALFAATDLPQEAVSAFLVAKEVALQGVLSETTLRRLREYLVVLDRRGSVVGGARN